MMRLRRKDRAKAKDKPGDAGRRTMLRCTRTPRRIGRHHGNGITASCLGARLKRQGPVGTRSYSPTAALGDRGPSPPREDLPCSTTSLRVGDTSAFGSPAIGQPARKGRPTDVCHISTNRVPTSRMSARSAASRFMLPSTHSLQTPDAYLGVLQAAMPFSSADWRCCRHAVQRPACNPAIRPVPAETAASAPARPLPNRSSDRSRTNQLRVRVSMSPSCHVSAAIPHHHVSNAYRPGAGPRLSTKESSGNTWTHSVCPQSPSNPLISLS